MKQIRVAMIAPPWISIPPHAYGGIENMLDALIPALLKIGVKVELFTVGTSTIKSNKKHYLYEEGQYQYLNEPLYSTLPIPLAHLMFSLNRVLADGKFDVIHDHNYYVGPFVAAYSQAKLPPVIHTLHGPPFWSADRSELNIPSNLPMWKQFKSNNRLFIVGVSDLIAKKAPRSLKPLLLPSVHNAVDANNFPYVSKKSDYFVSLSRLHPEKGQDLAIQACMDLGYKLKIAGSVGDIESLKKLLMELANPLSKYRNLLEFRYYSDKIFPFIHEGLIDYVGAPRGKRKMTLLGKARALLFPVQWDEPFGVVPLEALACGTPVIAMNRGSMPEIIEHGVNGFLANSMQEFKKYMTKIDQIDPADCRKSVEERFSADIMAKRYLDRYRMAIKLAGSRAK